MNLDELRASLEEERPPAGLPSLLRALWLDAKGDWKGAHEVAQECEGGDGAWVHAYLHRKEGDPGNAGYWYGQAGRSPCRDTLQEEWETIARYLLGDRDSRPKRKEREKQGG